MWPVTSRDLQPDRGVGAAAPSGRAGPRRGQIGRNGLYWNLDCRRVGKSVQTDGAQVNLGENGGGVI